MVKYLNPTNVSFAKDTCNEIYVDKSMLIEYTNKVINTQQSYLCVSRPRRFGKSTDAHMLVAYYSKEANSKELFDQLNVSQTDSYLKHINKYNVIHLNIQDFLSSSGNVLDMIASVSEEVLEELQMEYHQYCVKDLYKTLNKIFLNTHEQFIFIIDEWDCVLRVHAEDKEAQKTYLDFLRMLLKDKPYVALAYMTGILPIKKYGTHSALNMFDEVSMIDPLSLSGFMGFTETEVQNLCKQYNVDFGMMKSWYDGYRLKQNTSVYNPKSVVTALMNHDFGNYWTQTETYEALKLYINKNIDGLKDTIVSLLSGNDEKVNVARFVNDMTTINSKDDVLTLLIHLGYLGYDSHEKTVYIPNREVRDSFIAAIDGDNYKDINRIVENSYLLL